MKDVLIVLTKLPSQVDLDPYSPHRKAKLSKLNGKIRLLEP